MMIPNKLKSKSYKVKDANLRSNQYLRLRFCVHVITTRNWSTSETKKTRAHLEEADLAGSPYRITDQTRFFYLKTQLPFYLKSTIYWMSPFNHLPAVSIVSYFVKWRWSSTIQVQLQLVEGILLTSRSTTTTINRPRHHHSAIIHN